MNDTVKTRLNGYAQVGRVEGFNRWAVGFQNLYLQLAYRANWGDGEIGTPEGRVRLAAGQAWMDLGEVARIAGWEQVDKSTVSRRLDEFCRLTGTARTRTRMGMLFTLGAGAAEAAGRLSKEGKDGATRMQRRRNADATETQHQTIESEGVAEESATETQQRRNADATPAQHSYDKEESKEETKTTSTPPNPPLPGGAEAAEAVGGSDSNAQEGRPPALWPEGGAGEDYLTPADVADLWNRAAAVTPGLQRVTVPLSIERQARAEKRLRSLPRREQWVRALSLLVRTMGAGAAGRVTTFDQLLRANEVERIIEAADEFYDGAGQASLMLPIETVPLVGAQCAAGDGARRRPADSAAAASPAEEAARRYGNQERASAVLARRMKR
jgi:hypothetical protein